MLYRSMLLPFILVQILFLLVDLGISVAATPPAGEHRGATWNGVQMIQYDPKLLFQQQFSRPPTHYLTVWPRKSLSVSALGERDVEVEIGQNLLDQFISTRLIHLITDKITGLPLPIETIQVPIMDLPILKKTFKTLVGGLMLKIENIRVHKVRIADLQGLDPDIIVEEDDEGGHFVEPVSAEPEKSSKHGMSSWFKTWRSRRKPQATSTPDPPSPIFASSPGGGERSSEKHVQFSDDTHQEEPSTSARRSSMSDNMDAQSTISSHYTANPASVMFLSRDHVKVAIKGFNMILTADYSMSGLDGNAKRIDLDMRGNTWIRVMDGVLFTSFTPTAHPESGEPTILINPFPTTMKMGHIQMQFDGSDLLTNTIRTHFSKVILKKFRQPIANLCAWVLQEELPAITEIMMKALDNAISQSTNAFLQERAGFAVPAFPQLVIEDFRWQIKDYKFISGFDLRHITGDEREELEDMMGKWLEDSEGELHRQQMDTNPRRTRQESKRVVAGLLKSFRTASGHHQHHFYHRLPSVGDGMHGDYAKRLKEQFEQWHSQRHSASYQVQRAAALHHLHHQQLQQQRIKSRDEDSK